MSYRLFYTGLLFLHVILIIIALSLEYVIRDRFPLFARKEHFFKHGIQASTFIMGNSHGNRNIDPFALDPENVFCLANASETWVKTAQLFEKVVTLRQKLKYLILAYNYHQLYVSDCTGENQLNGGMYYHAWNISPCRPPQGFQCISTIPYIHMPLWQISMAYFFPSLGHSVQTNGFSPYPGTKEYNDVIWAEQQAHARIQRLAGILKFNDLIENERNLRQLLNMAREQQLKVALVRTPMTDAFCRFSDAAFIRAADSLAAVLVHDFPNLHYINHGCGLPIGLDLFHDSDHLTGEGARYYTKTWLKPALDSLWGPGWAERTAQ